MSENIKRTYWVQIREADMWDSWVDEYEKVVEYEDGRVEHTGETYRVNHWDKEHR